MPAVVENVPNRGVIVFEVDGKFVFLGRQRLKGHQDGPELHPVVLAESGFAARGHR